MKRIRQIWTPKSNLIINQIKENEHQRTNIFNHHLFEELVDEIAIPDIIKLSFDKNITHYNFPVHKTHADSPERYHMNGLGIDAKAISYLITNLNSFCTWVDIKTYNQQVITGIITMKFDRNLKAIVRTVFNENALEHDKSYTVKLDPLWTGALIIFMSKEGLLRSRYWILELSLKMYI